MATRVRPPNDTAQLLGPHQTAIVTKERIGRPGQLERMVRRRATRTRRGTPEHPLLIPPPRVEVHQATVENLPVFTEEQLGTPRVLPPADQRGRGENDRARPAAGVQPDVELGRTREAAHWLIRR